VGFGGTFSFFDAIPPETRCIARNALKHDPFFKKGVFMTDPIKSGISRCQHRVYNPHGTPSGIDNNACSICTPIQILEKETPKTLLIKIDGSWKNLAKK
jgi:hypothetical protein